MKSFAETATSPAGRNVTMRDAVPNGLHLLAIAAQLAWVARLWALGLPSRYRFLTLYLLFSTFSSLGVLAVYHAHRLNGEIYMWVFVLVQPVGWTLLLCVVLDIYQRMIADYEGLARFGRLVMYTAVGLVTLLLMITLLLDGPDGTLAQWRNFWFRQERSVYLGLCLLSVVLAGFGAYFRLRVTPNVAVVLSVFGAIFAGQAFTLTLVEHFGEIVNWKDAALPLWHGACLFGGAWAFSAGGEGVPARLRFGDGETSSSEQALTRHLEDFNRRLLKVLRP